MLKIGVMFLLENMYTHTQSLKNLHSLKSNTSSTKNHNVEVYNIKKQSNDWYIVNQRKNTSIYLKKPNVDIFNLYGPFTKYALHHNGLLISVRM